MVSSEFELPAGYAELLEALKTRIADARIQAQRTVNTLVIEPYWSLGKAIIARQTSQGWGLESSGGLQPISRSPFPI